MSGGEAVAAGKVIVEQQQVKQRAPGQKLLWGVAVCVLMKDMREIKAMRLVCPDSRVQVANSPLSAPQHLMCVYLLFVSPPPGM